MSVRYEGAPATSSISMAVSGREVGEDVIPDGQVALIINYDEVFYIQGTVAQLRDFITRADRALRRVEESQTKQGVHMQKQYRELAAAIADQAQGIADGYFEGQSLIAAVALLKQNIITLEAWTPKEE